MEESRNKSMKKLIFFLISHTELFTNITDQLKLFHIVSPLDVLSKDSYLDVVIALILHGIIEVVTYYLL